MIREFTSDCQQLFTLIGLIPSPLFFVFFLEKRVPHISFMPDKFVENYFYTVLWFRNIGLV